MIGRLLIWTGVLKPLQPSPSSRDGVHDCPGEVMGLSDLRLIGLVIVEAVKLVGRAAKLVLGVVLLFGLMLLSMAIAALFFLVLHRIGRPATLAVQLDHTL